jgi:hypothetical protein
MMLMKKIFMNVTIVIALLCPIQLFAADDLSEADALFDAGGIQNLKESESICEKIASVDPNNFEANRKTAMTCREYAEQCKRNNIPGWEEICKNFGKKGMQYAEIAVKLDPSKVYGNYYYGACAGSYLEG